MNAARRQEYLTLSARFRQAMPFAERQELLARMRELANEEEHPPERPKPRLDLANDFPDY